jgi:thiosulfate/3-mercaptopyruvate sulfurtransferase
MRQSIALVICVLLVTWVRGARAEDAEYARPDLLVEPQQLSRLSLSSEVRTVVLDARSKEEFEKGHLPGAIWVDVDEWKQSFRDGTDAKGWSERIGKLGIDNQSRVVVYDEALTGSAARVWWILRYWGLEDARLLNGGFKAWEAEKHGTTTETVDIQPLKFKIKAQDARLVTYDELKEQLKNADEVQLFDARTVEEFEAGRIASCNHLDWRELVDAETGKLLPPMELDAKLKKAGFDPKQPMITYCQSGGRASVMAFVLELMGGDQVANYHGSWGDWTKHEEADR